MEIINSFELCVGFKVFFCKEGNNYAVILEDNGVEINLMQGTNRASIETFYNGFLNLYC